MTTGFFVTGTDTGVGKTLVSCALLHALRARGLRAVGMKPVASGCEQTSAGLRNDDALALQAASSSPPDYAVLNPYAFAPAIAPHLAGQAAGVAIEFAHIRTCYQTLARQADAVVVEGAGGWRVPLGPAGDMADLAAALGLPVILVVGLRLGCLNHALLSADAIRARGLTLAGWVANALDPEMAERAANVATLEQTLPAPCLGYIPYQATAASAALAKLLDLERLLYMI